MSESTGIIKASVVEQSKEAGARASLGFIVPPLAAPDPLSAATFTMLASHEHGDPSALVSKDARPSMVSCCKSKSSKKIIEGCDQVNRTELELELELQRKVVDGHCSELPSQTSLEIPDLNTLSPTDQVPLASTSRCRLEEMAAHGLMQAAALTHQLTLQRAKWEKERRDLSEEIEQLKREKEEAEVKAKRQAAEFIDWSEKAEHLLLKCKLEIERLEQGCEDSFNAGRAAGRLEVAESEEYRAAIRKARLSGAKDCLSSRMFELRWAAKLAEHEVIGFKKCQKQVLKLGGFKKGFNLGLLDSAMDGNLEVAENADGDELESGSVGEEMGGC